MAHQNTQTRAGYGEGLPQWDQSKQQYTKQIGYCFDDNKKRIRKVWNLGKDYLSACEAAIALRKLWEIIVVENWQTFRKNAEGLLPGYDWSKPVWQEAWMAEKATKNPAAVSTGLLKGQEELARICREMDAAKERIAALIIRSAKRMDPMVACRGRQRHMSRPMLLKRGMCGAPSELLTGVTSPN